MKSLDDYQKSQSSHTYFSRSALSAPHSHVIRRHSFTLHIPSSSSSSSTLFSKDRAYKLQKNFISPTMV